MPGYNHYLNCRCGWCDKTGQGGFNKGTSQNYFSTYSAKAFLSRNNAPRGGAACFVNPNARCPVCDAPVFYYQNEYGSRVFFDDLGPPWPKHGCTDNTERKGTSTLVSKPTRRNAGLIAELIEAASEVGLRNAQSFHNFRILQQWSLVEIISIIRQGFKNQINGRFIEVKDERNVYFAFELAKEMISIGDIVSIREHELSLWDFERDRPKSYKIVFFTDDKFSTQI